MVISTALLIRERGAHSTAISDVLDMYIGESERKLHELFELARRTAPAVVFFDEVEAIGGKRQLCFTEFGYLTPEGFPPLPGGFAWAQNVTLADQANWLRNIYAARDAASVKLWTEPVKLERLKP